jgi:hypothetical protein
MKQMQSQQNTAFASLMQIMGKIAGKLSWYVPVNKLII